VKLEEEADQGTFALLLSQDIIAKFFAPVIDLEEAKALFPITVQQIDHFFCREMMPVSPNQVVHGYTLLPTVENWESRRGISLISCASQR